MCFCGTRLCFCVTQYSDHREGKVAATTYSEGCAWWERVEASTYLPEEVTAGLTGYRVMERLLLFTRRVNNESPKDGERKYVDLSSNTDTGVNSNARFDEMKRKTKPINTKHIRCVCLLWYRITWRNRTYLRESFSPSR